MAVFGDGRLQAAMAQAAWWVIEEQRWSKRVCHEERRCPERPLHILCLR